MDRGALAAAVRILLEIEVELAPVRKHIGVDRPFRELGADQRRVDAAERPGRSVGDGRAEALPLQDARALGRVLGALEARVPGVEVEHVAPGDPVHFRRPDLRLFAVDPIRQARRRQHLDRLAPAGQAGRADQLHVHPGNAGRIGEGRAAEARDVGVGEVLVEDEVRLARAELGQRHSVSGRSGTRRLVDALGRRAGGGERDARGQCPSKRRQSSHSSLPSAAQA